MATIPRIDPNVRHLSLGYARRLTLEDLAARTYVVEDTAVIMPMATFLEMQKALEESERGGIQ